MEKSKKMKYVLCIYQYGITPYLMLLKQHEEYEDYEECHIMLEAINHVNQFFEPELLLDTKYNENTLKYFYSNFKEKHHLEIAEEMLPNYIEEIKKYVL